jgi:hypothetical protein
MALDFMRLHCRIVKSNHLHVTMGSFNSMAAPPRSGDQRGPCSEPPASPRLRAERQRYGQRQARRPIITTPSDSAHDITQYRLDRRDIVGIASLLNQHIIPATVSIPLAGGRLRRRARILYVFATSAPRASASSEPSSAYHRRPERSGGLKESE